MSKKRLKVDEKKCLRCFGCVSVCPKSAIEGVYKVEWDKNRCIYCNACVKFCPVQALEFIDNNNENR